MAPLIRDLRYAVRMLRKSPGFTIVAVLTLALGIGANTAIFSVVNTVLLRSLPFPNDSQLVDISARSSRFDFSNLGLSLPDIADVRANAPAFASLATYQDSSMELSGEGQPEHIETAEVSEGFFTVLGLQPLYGRLFTSSDMLAASNAVVLGYSLWREKFGGDPAAIGKSVTLNGQSRTIIGVIPAQPSLGFVTDSQLWIPFVPLKEDLAARENHAVAVLARLKPNARLEQGQSELDTIAARLAAAYPEADKGWTIHVSPLKSFLLGDARTPLTILFCAAGFVLVIACLNVSNLFLARGWARRREFAIRSAMGATRAALLRQLTVESMLVALAGGVCAYLFTTLTVRGLRMALPPDIPRIQDLRIETTVAWFTVGASILAALISGVAPALLSSRQNLGVAMKESGVASGVKVASDRHNFLRQLLVIGEIALAVILLIGATLAVRSFDRLLRVDLGFRPDHLVTMKIDFAKFRFANAEQAIAFVQQILDESRGVPGVTAASASLVFPLSDEVAESTFQTERSANDQRYVDETALVNVVAPDFFHTFGIPLLAGRDFNNSDTKDNSPVFIVNEALARRYFGSVDVRGRRFSTHQESGHPVWGQIVAVASNVHQSSPGVEPKPEIYAPFYQTRSFTGVYLAVRTKPDPLKVVSAIQDRIWFVDKNQPITAIQTIDARIAEVNATSKSQSLLLGLFGGLGFVLALVGVYGVTSYLVSLRTREIGIRMALGADSREILRLVIAHGLKLTLTGVFIGVAGSLVLTRFMRSFIFGISATDPPTFVSIAVLLTLISVAACSIPARRAMAVDPIVALRCE
jgi:putative ABC transport system permease protein